MGARLRVLAFASVLVALAAIAVWAVPRALDWDGHRAELAAIAGERLGRPVVLEGPITVSLLPEPWLSADRIRVGEAADEIGVSARGLRLRLDPWSFLLGRLDIREVALVGADIRLPWPPTALPGLFLPGWLSALDIRIEDSRIAVGNAAVEGVSARFAAGGPAEAVAGTGQFRWRGQVVRFDARLGRATGDDGVAPLDVTLTDAAGGTMRARGVLFAQGGFEGRLDAAG
ncbi:MAG: AsmA family protein, partial [Acetobacteraceae bacterium]|nr:AsmA family protein [Acetobacteraceae bacterium]